MKNKNGNEFSSQLSKLGESSKFNDIAAALKADHKVLRELGETLTSEDATAADKKEAYQNFSSLLKSHAKSEERAVYERCLPINDLTQEADEGYVEHEMADTLMEKIATCKDKDEWNAMVKVLAEVVEHHADEEEKELLPDLKRHFEKADQADMTRKFINLREKSQQGVNEDNAGILAQVHAAQKSLIK